VSNPLLHFTGLPKFNEIKPEHVSPALDSLLEGGRALVDALAASTTTPTWQNFALELENMDEKIWPDLRKEVDGQVQRFAYSTAAAKSSS